MTWCLFICLHVYAHPITIRKRYRQRFGIESTYRGLEQERIRTSSRNSALCLMLLSLAAVVSNSWIWLHWRYLRWPSRGLRRVAHLLRFAQFKAWVRRAIEPMYKAVRSIDLIPFMLVTPEAAKL